MVYMLEGAETPVSEALMIFVGAAVMRCVGAASPPAQSLRHAWPQHSSPRAFTVGMMTGQKRQVPAVDAPPPPRHNSAPQDVRQPTR